MKFRLLFEQSLSHLFRMRRTGLHGNEIEIKFHSIISFVPHVIIPNSKFFNFNRTVSAENSKSNVEGDENKKAITLSQFANYSANVDSVTEKRLPGRRRRSTIFFADNRSAGPFPSNIRSDSTFLIVHTSSSNEYTHEDRRRKREERR